jgi:type II secretory pathway pseudopilin PulG
VNAHNAVNDRPNTVGRKPRQVPRVASPVLTDCAGLEPWSSIIQRPQRSGAKLTLEAGFTLLEICFVLFIVAVLFAVAAPPVAKQFQEEQIRKPIRELQGFAKTARRLAMEQNRPYQILLLNSGYLLEPLERKEGDKQSLRYDLPDRVTFEIQRPTDQSLQRVEDARWVFTANGLCEPITFFFQRGNDWVRFRIDALTARIENEESFIQ